MAIMFMPFVYCVAEFGDFDEQKHTDEFLSDYIFLPPVRLLHTHFCHHIVTQQLTRFSLHACSILVLHQSLSHS